MYTHTGTSSPSNSFVIHSGMHEQVAKSLVYASAGESTCMSIHLCDRGTSDFMTVTRVAWVFAYNITILQLSRAFKLLFNSHQALFKPCLKCF